MKKMFIYSFLMACTGVLISCEDTYNTSPVYDSNATIKVTATNGDVNNLTVSHDEETLKLNVETTASEWNAYSNQSWISVKAENTVSKTGVVTVTVAENLDTLQRIGEVVVMSGTARTHIRLVQEKSLIYTPAGYKMVWNDEFNGTELNESDWTHEVWGKGTVNDEQQYYVNHLSPNGKAVTQVSNGTLKINCFKEDGKIYSGRIYAHVKEGWKYGYIEASIKLPKGKGTWPAFWMMPVNFTSWPADGEIDIMEEVGGNPNYVSSSLHANAHVHSNGTQVTHEMYLEGAEDGFHTYAIEWTHENITTYVDGQQQLSYDNRGLGRDDWPYDDPFYVILNLAWGGTWGGTYGIDEGALPVTMEVDYVRVFQKK